MFDVRTFVRLTGNVRTLFRIVSLRLSVQSQGLADTHRCVFVCVSAPLSEVAVNMFGGPLFSCLACAPVCESGTEVFYVCLGNGHVHIKTVFTSEHVYVAISAGVFEGSSENERESMCPTSEHRLSM